MADEAKVKEEGAGDRITIKVQDQARPRAPRCAASSLRACQAAWRVLTRRGVAVQNGSSVQFKVKLSTPFQKARVAPRTAHGAQPPPCPLLTLTRRAVRASDFRRVLQAKKRGSRHHAVPSERAADPGHAHARRGALGTGPPTQRAMPRLTTAASQLEMEDDDSIDAFVEQLGGWAAV